MTNCFTILFSFFWFCDQAAMSITTFKNEFVILINFHQNKVIFDIYKSIIHLTQFWENVNQTIDFLICLVIFFEIRFRIKVFQPKEKSRTWQYLFFLWLFCYNVFTFFDYSSVMILVPLINLLQCFYFPTIISLTLEVFIECIKSI